MLDSKGGTGCVGFFVKTRDCRRIGQVKRNVGSAAGAGSLADPALGNITLSLGAAIGAPKSVHGAGDGSSQGDSASRSQHEFPVPRVVEKTRLDQDSRHIGSEQNVKERLFHAPALDLVGGRGERFAPEGGQGLGGGFR